jgi:hypothetical protein
VYPQVVEVTGVFFGFPRREHFPARITKRKKHIKAFPRSRVEFPGCEPSKFSGRHTTALTPVHDEQVVRLTHDAGSKQHTDWRPSLHASGQQLSLPQGHTHQRLCGTVQQIRHDRATPCFQSSLHVANKFTRSPRWRPSNTSNAFRACTSVHWLYERTTTSQPSRTKHRHQHPTGWSHQIDQGH